MTISHHLQAINARIANASARAGRNPDDVTLLAVTKTRTIDEVNALYSTGLRDFGESRVQELLKKKDQLPADIRWHFIGHLQKNKAKQITPFVHTIHSVHSAELATELSKRSVDSNRTIEVLIEVNISAEAQKLGADPDVAESLVLYCAEHCPNLIPTGLMGMASFEEDPERTRPQFRKLRELRDQIAERHPELNAFKELSMGMSNDFEIAIQEVATIIRIGSALFEE